MDILLLLINMQGSLAIQKLKDMDDNFHSPNFDVRHGIQVNKIAHFLYKLKVVCQSLQFCSIQCKIYSSERVRKTYRRRKNNIRVKLRDQSMEHPFVRALFFASFFYSAILVESLVRHYEFNVSTHIHFMILLIAGSYIDISLTYIFDNRRFLPSNMKLVKLHTTFQYFLVFIKSLKRNQNDFHLFIYQ